MLANYEQAVPWGLFMQDLAWRRTVMDDLDWLWGYVHNTTTLRDPRVHPGDWLYVLRYHQKYWKILVHRATKLDVLKKHDDWQLRMMHHQVFEHFLITGEVHGHRPVLPQKRSKATLAVWHARKDAVPKQGRRYICSAAMALSQTFVV